MRIANRIQDSPFYKTKPRPAKRVRKGVWETEDGMYRFVFFSRAGPKGGRVEGWERYHLHQARWKKIKSAKSTHTLRAARACLEIDNNNRVKANNRYVGK